MTIPQAGGPIGSRAKISTHHPPTKALAKPVSPGSVFAKTPPTGRRPYRNAADALSEPQAILRATTRAEAPFPVSLKYSRSIPDGLVEAIGGAFDHGGRAFTRRPCGPIGTSPGGSLTQWASSNRSFRRNGAWYEYR